MAFRLDELDKPKQSVRLDSIPEGSVRLDSLEQPATTAGFGRGFTERPEEKLPVIGQAIKGARWVQRIGAAQRLQGDYDYSVPISPGRQVAGAQGWIPALYANKEKDISDLQDYFIQAEQQYSTAGKAGQIISEMPAFAIDFMLAGGAGKIGTAGGKLAITKLLGRLATTTAGRATIATGGFAIGTALRSTAMPVRAVNAVLRRQAPTNMDVTDGRVTIVGPVETPMMSLYKGLADHYIEIASEQAGEFLVPGFGKLVRRTPFLGKAMSRIRTRWLKLNPAKHAKDFIKKVGTTTGFHGVLGEVGEEYLGDITRAIMDVDDFGAGPEASRLERIGAAVKADTDNLPAMLIAFGIPGGAVSAINVKINRDIQRSKNVKAEYKRLVADAYVDQFGQIPTEDFLEYQATAESTLGYEDDFFSDYYEEHADKYNFEQPDIFKFFTPKWLLNRMLGLELLLEDVNAGQTSLQLEQAHLNGWVSSLTKKLRKLKTLARLPDELPAIAVEEAPEKLVSAAIRLKSGEMLLGETHVQILKDLAAKGRTISNEEFDILEGSGFYTNKDSYVTAREGWDIAEQAEQINPEIEDVFREAKNLTAENVEFAEPGVDVTATKARILSKKISSLKPVAIMRDLLDTYEDAPAWLTEDEARIFNQVREVTRYLRKRANLVRAKMGLPLIQDVKGYITHWMDKTANLMMAKDLPIHSGYLYRLMRGLPKEVRNPTALRRKIVRDMNNHFSKNLGKLLRTMVSFDLKDIHLKQPYEAAWDELQELRRNRMIPDSTYQEAENYLLYDIRKHAAPMDKAFNKTVSKPIDLLNKLLPIKKVIDDPARQVFSTVRRLGFMGGLALRLKPAGRNLGQRLLLTDLYRTQDLARAQAVAFRLAKMPEVLHPITGESISIIELIREQDWYKMTLHKFEDQVTTITGAEKVGLHLYSRTHVGNLFISNVEVSALTGYFDWKQMREQSVDEGSKHFRNAVVQAKVLGVPVQQLLTQDSDMMWNIRETVRRTQWEYFNMSMPVIYRSQFNRAMGMFQSWWMNYFFNHSRAMINQTLTGRNDLGRLLTPGGRLRAVKGLGTITAIGKASKALLGIEMLKYLVAPIPGYLPPLPELIIGIMQYFGAPDEKARARAWKRIAYGLKFWIPFSAFGRDFNKLLSGEYDLGDFLFYRTEKE
jgi:hypothetical protein